MSRTILGGLGHIEQVTLERESEVDGTRSAMIDYAVEQSCVLSGEMLSALYRVLAGIEIYPNRMRANLELSGGLIRAEAVMMSLARTIGRQEAHEVVHHAAHVVATDATAASFLEVLAADQRVSAHLTPREISELLDPAGNSGLSPRIAHEASARAYAVAVRPRPTWPS